VTASHYVLALALVACGGQAKKVEHASVLLAETAEVVRRWYSTFEVDPRGTIRTSWQQIPPQRREPDPWHETRTHADRDASRRRYFVRFNVAISNTRPARIEVTGHAAMLLEGGTAPREFRREDEPGWTSELADKLRLKIHTRLERFAR
jgi:hypothetical protein